MKRFALNLTSDIYKLTDIFGDCFVYNSILVQEKPSERHGYLVFVKMTVKELLKTFLDRLCLDCIFLDFL